MDGNEYASIMTDKNRRQTFCDGGEEEFLRLASLHMRWLSSSHSALTKERDEALAKLAAMESQPPYRWLVGDRAWEGENIAKVRASAAASSFGERIEAIPVYAKPVPADKPAVAVPIDWKLVPVFPTPEMIHRGAIARQMPSAGTGDIWDAMLAAAPSHSQQSARITSADQFINGRYYWVKLTNPKVVSYGETVIWEFTDIPRGNPFLAHHPVDSKLFANAEIYGPVPMPELSREHCPSQQSAHRITKQDAREIAESLEYYFDNIRQEFDFSAWWGSKGRELLGKLNADRCPSHESEQGGAV